MNLQPEHLHNEWVSLTPLRPDDLEELYAAAKDPLIWEQHPNPDRYKRAVFETYFRGAIESGSERCRCFYRPDAGCFYAAVQEREIYLEASVQVGTTYAITRRHSHGDGAGNKVYVGRRNG